MITVSEALPRRGRITKKADFQRAQRQGVWMRGESFDVIFAKSPCEQKRLGVIVPLFSHGVVERNRLKRRIREILRRLVLPLVSEDSDIIVKAKKNAYSESFLSARAALLGLSRRLVEGGRGD